ncbi:MAG: hypothetical protein KME46_21565 [Brasilonema angustatum HA4187-MV1]|jgi:hypothetical protein|nr:hypothetical protein [Brasilonema angustatum HA4187-MV1]
MKKVKQMIAGGLGTIAISVIGLAQAGAVELPLIGDSPLAKVFEPLQQQLNSWNAYVSSILSDKLEPLTKSLGGDLQAAINEAMGALGLPDPTQTRKEVEKIAAGSTTPINGAERATNEVDRQITRAVADATLGKVGQQRTKEQVEKTQSSIQQVVVHAQAAQGEVVTQNVMKQIAAQNAQTAAILGAMRADGLRLQQSQDLANTNLTNISRAVDGQNQAKVRETVGQGFENYRTAARAWLF